jgi:hypothetical protein
METRKFRVLLVLIIAYILEYSPYGCFCFGKNIESDIKVPIDDVLEEVRVYAVHEDEDKVFGCLSTSFYQLEEIKQESNINKESLSSVLRVIGRDESNTRSGIPKREFDSALYVTNIVNNRDRILIYALSRCVREHVPTNFESRSFYSPEDSTVSKKNSVKVDGVIIEPEVDGYSGGNNVTYIAGFMQAVVPTLWSKITTAISAALVTSGWREQGIAGLTVRCIEHLVYGESDHLAAHEDSDSAYTIVIMLSEQNKYTGGDFLVADAASLPYDEDAVPQSSVDILKNGLHRVELQPLSLLLIDSQRTHAVEPVLNGQRNVLVIEFWENLPESGAYDLRPDPEDALEMASNNPR